MKQKAEELMMFALEDNGKPVAFYPVGARGAYSPLLRLAGYSERAARKGEPERFPHLVHTVRRGREKEKEREQMPLFGELPVVRRPRLF